MAECQYCQRPYKRAGRCLNKHIHRKHPDSHEARSYRRMKEYAELQTITELSRLTKLMEFNQNRRSDSRPIRFYGRDGSLIGGPR